jgi:hypothetical protein
VDVPTDLGSIIADGVQTSVQAAVAAAVPPQQQASRDVRLAPFDEALANAADTRQRAMIAAKERLADARNQVRDLGRSDHSAFQMQAIGLTPEYIGAMRAAVPQLAHLGTEDFAGMRSVGVTPEFARDLVAAGFPSIDADDLIQARVLGLNGAYIRAMRNAGARGDLDDFAQLLTIGIDPGFVERARRAGVNVSDADEIVQLHALGGAPLPPKPPKPPKRGLPAASPPNWNVDPDDG